MFKRRSGRNLRRKNSDSEEEDEIEVAESIGTDFNNKPTLRYQSSSNAAIIPSSLLSFEQEEEEGDGIEFLSKKPGKSKKSKIVQKSTNLRNDEVSSVKFQLKELANEENFDAEMVEDAGHQRSEAFSQLVLPEVSVAKSVEINNLLKGIPEGIPDSNVIHQIRKKREMARKQQTSNAEFIPVREDISYKKSSERSRLVREDENDLSDAEEDGGKFFSSKSAGSEMDRRLAEANFLSVEQGDSDAEEQEAFENWEKEQLKKAVSSHQLSSYQQEQTQQQQLLRKYPRGNVATNFVSDLLDTDEIILINRSKKYPARRDHGKEARENQFPEITQNRNPELSGGDNLLESSTQPQSLEDIRVSLQQRLAERRDVLRSLNSDCDRVQDTLISNQTAIDRLQNELPKSFENYQFLQEMQSYVRDLVDCLDDKLPEVEIIEEKLMELGQNRRDFLRCRRTKDIADQYDECQTLSAGRKLDFTQDSERCVRVADREARRTRRRLIREKKISGISHQEGMSSDEEESPSQIAWFASEKEKIFHSAQEVFADVADEYASISLICKKIADWRQKYPDSFDTAYAGLYLPKLLVPLVRLHLVSSWNPCEISSQNVYNMDWFRSLIIFDDSIDENSVDEAVADLIPQLFEKVVCPRVTDYIQRIWDPVSTSQTEKLTQLIRSMIRDYPTITGSSKNVQNLLNAVVSVLKTCLSESIFMPLFSKNAVEKKSSGAAIFLDRQFWFSFKLLKNVLMWEDILSTPTLLQLALDGLLNRYVVLGLQCSNFTDVGILVKAKAIVDLIKPEWLEPKSHDSTWKQLEPLRKIIGRIAEEVMTSTSIIADIFTAKEIVRELHKCLQRLGGQNSDSYLVERQFV